jgi:hypothetical protein
MSFPQRSRRAAVMVFGVGLALSLDAQEKDGVSIEVDPSIRSEAVHVNYFLAGGFGGYADFTDASQPSTEEIFLPVYRDDQRAKSLKAVVYAKGCEFAKFTLDPLPPGPNRVRLECRKLHTVRLKGVVTGCPRPSELTVRLQYMANWSQTFFGILDGAVWPLPIAEVVPDPDGRFTVEVPDFANDAVTNSYKGQADWSITAWRRGTNDQYWLNTESQQARTPGTLPIEREYPEELQFMAKPF